MSTVTPPPPTGSSVPVTVPINATALLLNAPAPTLQALQALQPGQSLPATLLSAPGVSPVLVQTTLGQLTLQTPIILPRGAVLSLTLISPATAATPGQAATPATFQITTINDKPVSGGQSAPQGTTQPTVSTDSPIAPGQTLTATLLRPALGILSMTAATAPSTGAAGAGGTAAPSAGASGSGGAAVQGASTVGSGTTAGSSAPSITTAAKPAIGASSSFSSGQGGQGTLSSSGGAAAGQAAQGGSPAGPTTSAQTAGAPLSTLPATTLPVGTRFAVTVQRIDAPNAALTTQTGLGASSTAKALTAGQVLNGDVTGRTTGGQPIVQTSTATFALNSQGALSDGAKVTFRLNGSPLLPSTATGIQLRTLGNTHDLINAKTWDNLGEALKTLVVADPARLTQVAQSTLPQPGAKLSSQMLFFLSALKGGDLKGLFGETTLRIIDKERPGLLSRLNTDFQALSRLADEPQSNDWRLAMIPLWTGEKLDQIRFFWRGGGGEDGSEDGKETRFVLDLDLSNLGHMQIDGLMKNKRNHLDLIIRTDQPLPADMRADIAKLFEDARDTLGLGGQVAFQAAPGNFVAIPSAKPNALPLGSDNLSVTGVLA